MDDVNSTYDRDGLTPSGHTANDRTDAADRKSAGQDWQRLARIGDVHLGADNPASALEYYERALSLMSRVGTKEHERVSVELRVADSLRRLTRFAESKKLARDVLQRVFPEGRPDRDAFESEEDRLAWARLMTRLGVAETCSAEYASAREHCEEAYQVLRETDAHEDIAFLDLTLGSIAHRLGEIDRARECYESSLATYRRIDDSEGIARSLHNLGALLRNGPRWNEAKDYLTRALAVSEEAGNYARVASHCLNLGILYMKTGEWTLSSDHLTRALVIFKETDAIWGATKTRLALGNLKLRLRQFSIAESHYRHAQEAARERGLQREQALAVEFLGEMYLVRGELDSAERCFRQALAIARICAPEGDLVGEVKSCQARLSLQRGDFEAAIEFARESQVLATRIGDDIQAGASLWIQGRALAAQGDLDSAEKKVRASIKTLSRTPDVLERLQARRAWAHILVHRARGAEVPADRRQLRSEATSLLERISSEYFELDLPELGVLTLAELARTFADFEDLDEALVTVSRASDLAERHNVPQVRQRLETLRSDMEELCAESILAESAEFQLMEELVGFAPSDRGTTVEAYLRLACERSRSDRAVLAIRDESGQPRIESSFGFEQTPVTTRVSLLRVVLKEFQQGRTVHLVNDAAVDHRYERIRGTEEIGATVAIPLAIPEGRKGALYFERTPSNPAGAYRNADLRLISYFSGIVAVYLTSRGPERTSERETDPEDVYSTFISCSSEVRRSLNLLRKLGQSDDGVLITGETGTGKGLLARLVHNASQRADGRFVPVNCAALPESLLESELFGHEQGAFTGAIRRKQGLFEEAAQGTLFLDEVDKAPLGVQAKLLHVLDKHEIRPVGATRWKPVDVRVVCATNANLLDAIEKGAFLEDLYYRLNDFQVHLPPLRERREDIPLLVRHFYQQFAPPRDDAPRISRDALQALTEYDWRGNVRELEKVVKRVLVLAEPGETIGPDLLPQEVVEGRRPAPGSGGGTLREEVHRLEAQLIGDALRACGGNKSEVARRLKVSYPCLLSKIRQYDLEPRKGRRQ